MEKDIACKWKFKKSGVAMLISNKVDITRHKVGYNIMVKGSIQEDITTVNIYVSNIRASQYIKQMLTAIKGEKGVGEKFHLHCWFTVHVLLKPGLENFEHYFTSM